MKMKSLIFLLAVLLFFGTGLTAQNNQSEPASFVGTFSSMEIVPSLASRPYLTPADNFGGEVQDGRASKYDVIPGKGAQEEDDFFVRFPNQLEGKIPGRSPSLVFDFFSSNSSPTDPSIAVGPDHMFGVFNTGFIIFDKDGNDLTGQLNMNNIFPGSGCCDLTVSYDSAADRWVVSYLGAGCRIAVSDGPDPVTSDWYVYTISQISDYNKLSVWSDGYYLTQNGNIKVFAMERDKMLVGDPTAGIQSFNPPGMVTDGFSSCQVLNVTDDNMPAAGNATVVYLQDDAWAGVANDHIKLWSVNVDWDTPGNSTISAATQIVTTPFIGVFDGGSFSNLAQPGGGAEIDALQATIMNQAQFKKFPDHNSALFNFVVDADAGPGELAAIRWYELRQDGDGQPWSLFQEGTYTAPDGKHAWHASLMMDYLGNIGMGYTGMAGPTTPNPTNYRVSSYYTGRYSSDPPGTMSIAEELIAAGNANMPNFRYGDYSKIDIDPNNNKEFWFANEYMNGGRKGVVGVFQIASDFTNDIGAVSINDPVTGALTANEQITITLFNFGLGDAFGFDVSFQIDGGTIITEAFPDTLFATTSTQYTFTATGDFSTEGQTYSIYSTTTYGDDEFLGNDGVTQEVTHLLQNDLGVAAISSPVSGSGLSSTEAVTITIENFGSITQTSIPVFFSIDGGSPIEETYVGSIAIGESDQYTFTATVDLSALGDYEISSGTLFVGDANASNDNSIVTVSNFICQPESNCAGFDDGVTELELADQNISTICGPGGYSDDTDIIFNFVLNDNPFDGVLQMGWDDSEYSIWIDFNDNNSFENSEIIADGISPNADQDFNFTVDFGAITGVTTGMHIMRVRGGDENSGDGAVEQPCGDLDFGRTNDYTANLSGVVGLDDNEFSEANLSISYLADNQYELLFNTTSYTERLPITIYNVHGQKLAFYTLENSGAGYSKVIDMSYVQAGAYLIRVGGDNLNIVRRIVVK